jgi:uncharacterized protein YbbK (DUF523 family)
MPSTISGTPRISKSRSPRFGLSRFYTGKTNRQRIRTTGFTSESLLFLKDVCSGS